MGVVEGAAGPGGVATWGGFTEGVPGALVVGGGVEGAVATVVSGVVTGGWGSAPWPLLSDAVATPAAIRTMIVAPSAVATRRKIGVLIRDAGRKTSSGS